MLGIKELFAKSLRIKKVIKGVDKYIKKDVSIEVCRYGNNHAAWTFYNDLLDENSIVYSFGVGDDISFDLALINNYDLNVQAFDPTPRSIDWINAQKLPKEFVFHPVGLADFDGKAKFNPPENPEHISATMLSRPETSNLSYKVEVRSLKSIMAELGHKQINLLKMDIEGAEYQVIEHMRSKNIKPDQVLVGFHHHFKNVGVKKTVNAVKQLRQMGYLVFFISETGEDISFIKKELIPVKDQVDGI
jgi:FkbM family methyltransferase